MTRLETLTYAGLVLLMQGVAHAQDAAPEPTAPAPEAAPAPVEAQAQIAAPPVVEPPPEPAPMDAPVLAAPVEEPPPAVEEPAAEEEGSWSDALSLGMFVDTYYNFDWNRPRNQQANSLGHNPYVQTNGFGLAFLGLDASYSLGEVGATASLRFGPGAGPLIGQTDGGIGLDNIWQAYATWAPADGLTLDMGQFATIYGAEVGESWMNVNYTRGALYFNYQPFWHTGLRAGYQVNDMIKLTALVVNGVNEPLDADRAPDLGLQIGIAPADEFFLAIGWYGAPIEPDADFWKNFIDVVATVNVDALTLVGNFDLGIADDGTDTATYWGASIAARYGVSDAFGIGGRFEYLSDADLAANLFGESLITGTLTLEYLPADALVIRLDNRVEKADADIYTGIKSMTDMSFVSVLGVVAKTN